MQSFDVQWAISKCIKGLYTREILDCMDESISAQNNELIKIVYQDVLNILQSKNASLAMEYDIRNITTTLNRSIIITTDDFDMCVKLKPLLEIIRSEGLQKFV